MPAFSRCSVGVVSHVDVFLLYLWGGRLSPRPTLLPSSGIGIFVFGADKAESSRHQYGF